MKVTSNYKQERALVITEAWKNREDSTGGMLGTKFHNSWRAFRFTIKGKRAGCDDSWKDFKQFYADMYSSYTEGYILCRKDKTSPFSKDNCFWTSRTSAAYTRDLTTLTYLNKTQTLREWAMELDTSYNGLRQRYHRNKKNYTIEEILFGKQVKPRKWKSENESKAARASKLLSQYKHSDKAKGLNFNLDREWFVDNILSKSCTYCGSTDRIGADRVDNSRGHLTDNIIPACYTCNTVRQNHFSVEEMKKLGVTIREILNAR